LAFLVVIFSSPFFPENSTPKGNQNKNYYTTKVLKVEIKLTKK